MQNRIFSEEKFKTETIFFMTTKTFKALSLTPWLHS